MSLTSRTGCITPNSISTECLSCRPPCARRSARPPCPLSDPPRELGIRLTYNGNDIEQAITLDENSALDRKQIQEHGLQESHVDLWRGKTKIAGKKLLMIHTAPLRRHQDHVVPGSLARGRSGGSVPSSYTPDGVFAGLRSGSCAVPRSSS